MVVPVEVNVSVVAALVTAGLVPLHAVEDRQAIGRAVARVLDRGLARLPPAPGSPDRR